MFIGTDVEAVRQAQAQVLPAELHRRLISMKDVPRIVYMWKELRQQLYTEQKGDVRPPEADATSQEAESTADLLRKLAARVADVLDEDRIRRVAREEATRVLEARVPAQVARRP